MDKKTNRTLSGCLLWGIAFLLISGCLVPVSLFVSGMSTFFSEDLIAPTLGPYLCPENTVAEIISFESTIMEDGYVRPATSYEMLCKSPDDVTVKNLGGSYALIWTGIFIAISIILSIIFALLITPLIQRLLRKKPLQNPSTPPLAKI